MMCNVKGVAMTNSEGNITRLCTSPQLYRAFKHLQLIVLVVRRTTLLFLAHSHRFHNVILTAAETSLLITKWQTDTVRN